MSFGIRVVGFAGKVRVDSTRPNPGSWVKEYDPDAYEGGGFADFTDNVDEALKFETVADAWRFWTQESTVKPIREDGRPNRPLTSLNVSIEPIS